MLLDLCLFRKRINNSPFVSEAILIPVSTFSKIVFNIERITVDAGIFI